MTFHRIITADVLAGLRTLPDCCVQSVITSPPYYGLRDYKTAKWEGGDPACEHTISAWNDNMKPEVSRPERNGEKRQHCLKCGAIRIDQQIGLEKTPEEFVRKMVDVFREVRRVLRDDGTLWLNFGDSYATNGIYIETYKEKHPDHQDLHTSDSTRYPDSRKGTRGGEYLVKPKDMLGIPWRVAFALQSDGALSPQTMYAVEKIRSALLSDYDSWDEVPARTRAVIEELDREWERAHTGGWYLRSDIIWAKRNCMPESITDRPTKAHEYIFLLTKSAKYFYDGEAIREPASESYVKDCRPVGVLRQCVNEHTKYDRTDRQFRKIESLHKGEGRQNKQDLTGNPTYTGFNARWKEGQRRTQAGSNGQQIHPDGITHDLGDSVTRNKRTVWWINPQPRPEAHFATFPDELAETCIKAGTSAYGRCPKCGAPYQRILEVRGGTIGKGSWHPHENDEVTGQICGISHAKDYVRESKGWKPGCSCDAGAPIPCVVLDPFWGSGTVTFIARDLNRDSIGVELNPDYVKIGKGRLQVGSQLDTGVVQYEFVEVKE